MDRLEFLKLAGLGVASFGLGACGSSDKPQGSPAARGGRGGVVRIAATDGSPNDSLDPLRMERSFQILAVPQMYESLVDLDDGFQPQGRLAERFESDKAGKTWTFHLREGVTFHDGKPLTARDVIFSLTRALDPDEGSGSSLAGQLDGILVPGGMKAVDRRTVRFTLEKPYVFFPNALATRFARIYQDGVTDFAKPVGTGPFRFKSFSPGRAWEGERNPDYWNGEVLLDGCTVINVADESSRLSALLAGDLDVAFQVELSAVPDVEDGGYDVLEQPNAGWVPLALDSTFEAFENPDVVRALKLAVDREQVVSNVFGGFGSVGYDHPVPEGDPYFNESIAKPERDVEAAKEALAGAGYRNGLKLPALVAVNESNVPGFAAVVKEQLAEAGIQFDIKQAPTSTFWDNDWLKKPFYANPYLRRHPDEIMKLVFLSSGDWNMSKRRDHKIDAAITAAGETTDLEEQKEQYQLAEQLIAERDTTVVPAHYSRVSGVNPKVKGLETNVVTFLDLAGASIA